MDMYRQKQKSSICKQLISSIHSLRGNTILYPQVPKFTYTGSDKIITIDGSVDLCCRFPNTIYCPLQIMFDDFAASMQNLEKQFWKKVYQLENLRETGNQPVKGFVLVVTNRDINTLPYQLCQGYTTSLNINVDCVNVVLHNAYTVYWDHMKALYSYCLLTIV